MDECVEATGNTELFSALVAAVARLVAVEGEQSCQLYREAGAFSILLVGKRG